MKKKISLLLDKWAGLTLWILIIVFLNALLYHYTVIYPLKGHWECAEWECQFTQPVSCGNVVIKEAEYTGGYTFDRNNCELLCQYNSTFGYLNVKIDSVENVCTKEIWVRNDE